MKAKFKAEAYRLGIVFCLLSVPFGGAFATVAPMAADTGDIENPAIITFILAAMIYPLVALTCGVIAAVSRKRKPETRSWIWLALPAINIVIAVVAAVAM